MLLPEAAGFDERLACMIAADGGLHLALDEAFFLAAGIARTSGANVALRGESCFGASTSGTGASITVLLLFFLRFLCSCVPSSL